MSDESTGNAVIEEAGVVPPHPYLNKLSNFKPEEWRLTRQTPRSPLQLEDAEFIFVDTIPVLDEIVARLNKENEVAVTLETHSYRTFHGICCLLQISTRIEDYIIDIISLKDHLSGLKEIFTDTNVLKVMHRATRDLELLQQHLGLYVVNLFDTGTAGKLLNVESAQESLQDLARKYGSVKFDEDHQTSDWQVRPLPDSMVKYARQKVHYLLFAYDMLRNELIDKKKINECYEESTKLCTVVWYPGKYRLTPTAYMNSYKKTKATLNRQQLECFRLLFEWRYQTAEANDESVGYTLPNKDMFNIARRLPQKADAIAECCTKSLPPLVKENLQEIHKLILKAIENVTDTSSAALPREPRAGLKRALEKNSDNRGWQKHWLKRGERMCTQCNRPGHIAKKCKTDLIEASHKNLNDGSADRSINTTTTNESDQYPRGGGAPSRGFAPPFRGRGSPFRGRGPPPGGFNAPGKGRGGYGARDCHYTGFSVMKSSI